MRAAEEQGHIPIEQVMIYPDAAWIVRHGLVSEDETLAGMPSQWDPDPALTAVSVAGPLQRFEMQSGQNGFELFGPVSVQEQKIYAAFDRKVGALERQLRQVEWQLEVLASIGKNIDLAVAGPVQATALSTLMNFMDQQNGRLLVEQDRLKIAIEQALDQLDAAVDTLPQLQIPKSNWHLPGAAGAPITIRHDAGKMSWAPSYRVEVKANGRVLLHRDALILSDLSAPLSTPRLSLHALPMMKMGFPSALHFNRLSVSDPANPNAADTVKRMHLVGAYGGSQASESGADSSSNGLLRLQHSNGSWGKDPTRNASTSLALLSFLGIGYDHRTPNRFRRTIKLGLDYLQAQLERSGDIHSQALQLMALTESYAMTNDKDLLPALNKAYDMLKKNVVDRNGLQNDLKKNGILAGPTMVPLVAMALKSIKASSVELPINEFDKALAAAMESLLTHPDQEAAQISIHATIVFTGNFAEFIAGDPYANIQILTEWPKKVPTWIESGRAELVWLGALVSFQTGGEVWQNWHGLIRDQLINLSAIAIERDDINSVIPHQLGSAAAWSLYNLSLSIYYRYSQVNDNKGRPAVKKMKASLSLPNPQHAAQNWPLVLELRDVTLPVGEGIRRFAVDQQELPGTFTRFAVPARSSGVWRVLLTQNPLPTPLAKGPIDVMVAGRVIGTGALDFVEPRGKLRLDLGQDEAFYVDRSETFTEREVAGRRVRTVTVRFTLHGPDNQAVVIEEAMPRPTDPEVRLRSLSPVMEEDALDRALRDDPQWRFELTPKKGKAEHEIIYELRYPNQTRLEKGE